MTLPMTDAKYLARACGAAQFELSGNNNMQIAVPLEIVDENGTPYGDCITWFATMHGTPDKKGKTGKDRVVESLLYMGFASDDLTELMEISDADARRLLPDIVEIICAPEDYQNPQTGETKTTLKVKWVNRPGGSRAGFQKPIAKEDMRAFAAQMRSSLKNARGGAPSIKPANGTQRQQPRHPNAPGGEYDGRPAKDDIPF